MFIGAILIVLIAVSALITTISGGTINYSAIPTLLKLWVVLSLVLPIILVSTLFLVTSLCSVVTKKFKE